MELCHWQDSANHYILCQERIKPILRRELQSNCISSNPVINYNLGDELPKKIKDAKKAAQIKYYNKSYNKTPQQSNVTFNQPWRQRIPTFTSNYFLAKGTKHNNPYCNQSIHETVIT